jgi:hypothetical protein
MTSAQGACSPTPSIICASCTVIDAVRVAALTVSCATPDCCASAGRGQGQAGARGGASAARAGTPPAPASYRPCNGSCYAACTGPRVRTSAAAPARPRRSTQSGGTAPCGLWLARRPDASQSHHVRLRCCLLPPLADCSPAPRRRSLCRALANACEPARSSVVAPATSSCATMREACGAAPGAGIRLKACNLMRRALFGDAAAHHVGAVAWWAGCRLPSGAARVVAERQRHD